jgi:hypothetical protein
MEGGVEWPCRYCGGRFPDLSEHYPGCVAKRRVSAEADLRRLEAMEAARPTFGLLTTAATPSGGAVVEASVAPRSKGGRPRKHADRRAYMRAYMRDYMRARRLKGGG